MNTQFLYPSTQFYTSTVTVLTHTDSIRSLQITDTWNVYHIVLIPQQYSTIIVANVLYGCETWSITLREEHRLWVFENRVLRGIFGPKRDGVTGEWRKLHNEELNDLYCSPNIVRVIKSRRDGRGT